MYFQTQLATEDPQKANLCNEFFYSVFIKCSTEALDLITKSNHDFLSEIIILKEDVYNALISLDPIPNHWS